MRWFGYSKVIDILSFTTENFFPLTLGVGISQVINARAQGCGAVWALPGGSA